MKKVVFVVCLALFGFLAACNQTIQNDLSTQGEGYGGIRFNVVSDYREGFEETNFNGKFDEGEFLVPGMEVLLTPVDEKGNPTGEPLTYLTNQAVDPREGAVLNVPEGWYQPELVLPTELQGGKAYTWKLFEPPLPELPPIFVKNRDLFNGFYNVGCEFAGSIGRQWIEISGLDEYEKSPCYTMPPKMEDGISVELVQGSGCGPIQAIVTVHYAKPGRIPVILSASGHHAAMMPKFSPNPTSGKSTLTLTTRGVPPGTYQITVKDTTRGYSVPLTVTVNSSNFTVTIPDPNLEAAIRATLNIPAPTSITRSDMLLLTDLLADYRGIVNLEGLQCAENLSYLDINRNLISDLRPLSSLTSLEVLALQVNRISDLKPLSGLTNLYHLDLGVNQISNLSPLTSLSNLQNLLLQQNAITDISALVNNSGLGSADIIDLQFNALDLTNPNDPDLSNIYILETLRGVIMAY
jgi:hypothetical protein